MTKEQRAILFHRLLQLEVGTYRPASDPNHDHLTGGGAVVICDEVERVLAGVYVNEPAGGAG
jgi:hypothetical protein